MLSRMTILVLAGSFMLTGALAGESATEVDTSPLHGTWVIAALPPGITLPKECANVGFTIEPSTITMRSGALIVSASYRPEIKGRGFRLRQHSFKYNKQSNCQGVPGDYVMANYIENLEVELVGPRLRIYRPDREAGDYSEYTRAAASELK